MQIYYHLLIILFPLLYERKYFYGDQLLNRYEASAAQDLYVDPHYMKTTQSKFKKKNYKIFI